MLETSETATFPQSIKAARIDSTVFIIGLLSGTDVSISVVPVMERRIRLQGNNTGPVADLANAAAAIEKAIASNPFSALRFPWIRRKPLTSMLPKEATSGKWLSAFRNFS